MGSTTAPGVHQAACTRAAFWIFFWNEAKKLFARVRIHKAPRALRIEETLPLGERRFLAVVRWNQQTLLLGVTPQSIALLEPQAHLDTCLSVPPPESRA